MDQIQNVAFAAVGVGAIFLSIALGLFVSARHGSSRDQLKLDLFGRRWRIYATVANVIDRAIADHDLTERDQLEFRRGIAGSEFLFRSDIVDFIEKLTQRVDELRCGAARADHRGRETRSNALAWCHTNKKKLRPLFGRYMDLSKPQ